MSLKAHEIVGKREAEWVEDSIFQTMGKAGCMQHFVFQHFRNDQGL